MLAQLVEVIEGRAVDRLGVRPQVIVGHRVRGRRQVAVPVVRAVHPDGLEDARHLADLPHEVLRREAPLPQLLGQGVGRGRHTDAGRRQLGEQAGDEHGVARVIELELVDAQHGVARELLDRPVEAERTHHVRQLDERAERLRLGTVVIDRGQQVGLTHAEPAVEVDTGALDGLGAPPE